MGWACSFFLCTVGGDSGEIQGPTFFSDFNEIRDGML